ELDERAQIRERRGLREGAGHERARQLELVEAGRELPARRVGGADIVERYPRARGGEPLRHYAHARMLGERGGRELERQRVWIERPDELQHVANGRRPLDLWSRDVDRDAERLPVRSPRGPLALRRVDDPRADVPKLAGRLGDPHELAGKQDAELRMAPAKERLEAAAFNRKSTRLNSSHVKISYAVFC